VQHCTPETLALAALREALPEPDAAHLETCAACRAEVTSLQRSVAALAVPEFAASVAPVPPPPAVWAGIAAATGVGTAPRPEVLGPSAPARLAAAPPVPTKPAEVPQPRGEVRELRPRRSRLLLAMAASLLVGTGIGAGAVALANRESAEEVAAADLAPLDDRDATGNAEVVSTGDGDQLRVVLEAPAPGNDGFYEVWLLEPAVERMVQVGVVRPGTTTLDLPDGIDLAEYPIVDVSVEPLDGDPTHSGVSVARGVLES
jgi:anti-sigma-K factor RskA